MNSATAICPPVAQFHAVPSRRCAVLRGQILSCRACWTVILTAAVIALAANGAASDWPQFRGPDGNGVSAHGQIPAEWSANRNLAWKIPIPGAGWSQPIIVGDRIYLTTAVSDHPSRPKDYSSGTTDPHTVSGGKAPAPNVTIEWKVMAIDLPTGHVKWVFTVASGKPRYPIHPSNTYASETPAADARGIYAWFGAAGTVAALDHEGRLIWQRDLGVFRYQENLGSGSSLRIHKGLLYIQCFNEEQAFLVCLNAQDGGEKWRINRELKGTAWTTPLLWENKERCELIVCGQKRISSHDPLTGRELWHGAGVEMAGPSSPTADQNHLYFGFRSALKTAKLYALNPGAEGNQSVEQGEQTFRGEAWARSGAAPGMASPVAAGNCLYVVTDATVRCHDTVSGQEHFRQRLPGFRCAVASPIVIGGQVLFLDESGSAAVLKAGPRFEILGTSKLEDTFWASPAVGRHALVLRGVDSLYCIRSK